MLADRLLLLCATAILLWSNIAIAQEYDWVIDKIPKHGEINEWKPVAGKVDGQQYLAIQIDVGDESKSDFKPVLVFARIKEGNTYEPFAVWKIENLNIDLQVDIKNNSIYVRYDTAHHGVYSSTYQFKLQAGAFQLIGIESQSITPGAYAGVMKNLELWEGKSTNLLTAEATVWAQTFDLNKPYEWKQWEKALKRHAQGLPSTKAKTRKVRLKLNSRWYLEHFNPYDFREDFLCQYFDHNLKFHNSCK